MEEAYSNGSELLHRNGTLIHKIKQNIEALGVDCDVTMQSFDSLMRGHFFQEAIGKLKSLLQECENASSGPSIATVKVLVNTLVNKIEVLSQRIGDARDSMPLPQPPGAAGATETRSNEQMILDALLNNNSDRWQFIQTQCAASGIQTTAIFAALKLPQAAPDAFRIALSAMRTSFQSDNNINQDTKSNVIGNIDAMIEAVNEVAPPSYEDSRGCRSRSNPNSTLSNPNSTLLESEAERSIWSRMRSTLCCCTRGELD